MSFSSFAGIFPYIVSPVDPEGTIRERVLRDLVNYLVNAVWISNLMFFKKRYKRTNHFLA